MKRVSWRATSTGKSRADRLERTIQLYQQNTTDNQPKSEIENFVSEFNYEPKEEVEEEEDDDDLSHDLKLGAFSSLPDLIRRSVDKPTITLGMVTAFCYFVIAATVSRVTAIVSTKTLIGLFCVPFVYLGCRISAILLVDFCLIIMYILLRLEFYLFYPTQLLSASLMKGIGGVFFYTVMRVYCMKDGNKPPTTPARLFPIFISEVSAVSWNLYKMGFIFVLLHGLFAVLNSVVGLYVTLKGLKTGGSELGPLCNRYRIYRTLGLQWYKYMAHPDVVFPLIVDVIRSETTEELIQTVERLRAFFANPVDESVSTNFNLWLSTLNPKYRHHWRESYLRSVEMRSKATVPFLPYFLVNRHEEHSRLINYITVKALVNQPIMIYTSGENVDLCSRKSTRKVARSLMKELLEMHSMITQIVMDTQQWISPTEDRTPCYNLKSFAATAHTTAKRERFKEKLLRTLPRKTVRGQRRASVNTVVSEDEFNIDKQSFNPASFLSRLDRRDDKKQEKSESLNESVEQVLTSIPNRPKAVQIAKQIGGTSDRLDPSLDSDLEAKIKTNLETIQSNANKQLNIGHLEENISIKDEPRPPDGVIFDIDSRTNPETDISGAPIAEGSEPRDGGGGAAPVQIMYNPHRTGSSDSMAFNRNRRGGDMKDGEREVKLADDAKHSMAPEFATPEIRDEVLVQSEPPRCDRTVRDSATPEYVAKFIDEPTHMRRFKAPPNTTRDGRKSRESKHKKKRKKPDNDIESDDVETEHVEPKALEAEMSNRLFLEIQKLQNTQETKNFNSIPLEFFELVLGYDDATYFFKDMGDIDDGYMNIDHLADSLERLKADYEILIPRLLSQEVVAKTLEAMVSVVFYVPLITLFCLIMGIPITSVLVSVAAFLVSLTTISGTFHSSFSKSLLLVGFNSPFSIADRLLINGERRVIKQINTFYTVAEDATDKIVYIPHSLLADVPITNDTRTSQSVIHIDFFISDKTKENQLRTLKILCETYVGFRPRIFQSNGFIMRILSVQPGHYINVDMFLSVRKSWHYWQDVSKIKTNYIFFLLQCISALEIEYTLPMQPIMQVETTQPAEHTALQWVLQACKNRENDY